MNAPFLPSQVAVNTARLAQDGPDADLIAACQQAIWAIAVYCRAAKRRKRTKATRRAMLAELDRVCHLTAATMLGAAWKSAVISAWQGLGVRGGVGERLIASLLHEVRLLGTGGSNDGTIKLAHSA